MHCASGADVADVLVLYVREVVTLRDGEMVECQLTMAGVMKDAACVVAAERQRGVRRALHGQVVDADSDFAGSQRDRAIGKRRQIDGGAVGGIGDGVAKCAFAAVADRDGRTAADRSRSTCL